MEIRLKDLFKAILRRWLFVVIVVAVFAIAGFCTSKFVIKKEYTSSSQVLVTSKSINEDEASRLSESLVSDTCIALAKNSQLYVATAKNLKDKTSLEFSAGAISSSIKVSVPAKDTSVLNISCIWRDPYEAQKILASFSEEFQKLIQSKDIVFGNKLKLTYVPLSEPSLRTAPTSPNVMMWVVVSILLGGIISVIIIIFIEFGNNKVKNLTDVGNKFNTAVLGEIPMLVDEKEGIKKKSNTDKNEPLGKHKFISAIINSDNTSFAYNESFNMLAVNLNYSITNSNCKKLLVTSSFADSGKSSIVINSSISLANMGKKVLIIDNDLYNASIARFLNIEPKITGLDVISNGVNTKEAIMSTDYGVDVLTFGNKNPNHQRLLMSNEYKKLIEELSQMYDWMIFDTPPANLFSDVTIINSLCDASLMVIDYQNDHINDVSKAMSKLNENVLGLVLNKVEIKKSKGYGYGYGYKKYGSD